MKITESMAGDPVTVEPQAPVHQRESIADLFRRLIDDIVGLVRTELQLARAEVGVSIGRAASGVAAVAVGGMLALTATSCLLVATIAWLAEHVGLVAAALIVAAVLAVAAGVLIVIGLGRLKHIDLAPKRSAANLQRSVDMLKGD